MDNARCSRVGPWVCKCLWGFHAWHRNRMGERNKSTRSAATDWEQWAVRRLVFVLTLSTVGCDCRQPTSSPTYATTRTLPCAKDSDCLTGETCACENMLCSLPRQPANTTGTTTGLCIPKSDRLALMIPVRIPDGGWLLEATDASFATQIEADRASNELIRQGFRGD